MNKTTNRVTKAMRYTDLKALLNGETPTYGTTVEQAIEFIDKEMGLLARKNSGDKKPTKTQQENEKYKVLIMEFLANKPDDKQGYTCTEIIKAVPELNEFSTQKVAPLMRQLENADKVAREEVKGKTLFHLA